MSAVFEPGWLRQTVHDAHISIMVDHDPWFFEHFHHMPRPERPVSRSDAREIFERMDKRFKEWTGVSLVDFAALPTEGSR